MDADQLSLSPITFEALEKALEHEGSVSLKTTAKTKGLLPGGSASKVKTAALNECLDPTLNLFEKSESEKEPKVRITLAGIEALFAPRSPAERKILLGKAAEPLKKLASEVVSKLATSELKEVTKEQEKLAQRANGLRTELMTMLKEQLTGVERLLAETNAQANALRKWVKEEKLPVDDSPKLLVNDRPRSPSLSLTSDEEIDFRRDLCRELALAWEDSPELPARAALERVMFNTVGLEQVGEADEIIAFDAALHKGEPGVDLRPGQSAKVIEPGWQFTSPRGVLGLVRARVIAAPH